MGGGAPRFRSDLVASQVEADGVAYVEVTDGRNGKSFRFYDFEYAVAQRLDGRGLDDVAAELRAGSELDLTGEQLAAFADQLRSLGFLEDEAPARDADAPSVFPPLVDDESGAFDTSGFRGQQPQLPAPVRPAATPAPPAEAVPELLSSVTEQTITSFPPDVRPPGWAQFQAERAEAAARAAEAEPAADAPAHVPDEDTTPIQPPAPVPQMPFAVAASAPTAVLRTAAASSTLSEHEAPTVVALVNTAQEVPTVVALADTAPVRPGAAAPFAAAASPLPPAEELAEELADDLSDELTEEVAPGAEEPSGTLVTAMDRKAASFVVDAPAEETVRDLAPEPSPSDTVEAKIPDFEDTTPATEAGPRRNGHPLDGLRPVPPAAGNGAAKHDGTGAGTAFDADREQETPVASAPVPPPAPARALSSGNLTPAASSGRPTWPAYAALAVAAAAIIAAMVYKFAVNPEPPAITVRIVVPSPTTVYRYFDASARVERIDAPAFGFTADGKLAEIAAPGTRYNAGDVLAMLEAGRRPRTELAHNRERLAHYEQQRDQATQQNKRGEVRSAERKIAEKRRVITELEAALARFAVLAPQGGEIAEALAAVGDAVKANQPVLRAKGQSYRAVFELPAAEAQRARQLGFCQLKMDGSPLVCSLVAEVGDETQVVVELPNDPQVGAGKLVQLARERLDAVYPIPAAALRREGDSDRLFVVGGNGRAELRVVGVVDRNDTEAIIAQGLDVGDRVIVSSPPGLKPEARLLISETKTQ
jgi:multidrug efflux pump subunit AcrA (membrane-fusion protein)